MIRALIIEDEQHCIDRLTSLITDRCKDSVLLLGAFTSVEDGKQAIAKHQPDVVFLDVQIKDKTGFDLLQQLNDVKFEVIFTTAFEKYAVQAFKFSAIDYLLKPVDPDDLLRAVDKLKEKLAGGEMSQKLDVLFHNLKSIEGASKRISIPTINGLIFLHVADIIRCQSDVNYTDIFLRDRKKITVARTLKDFEEMLTDYNFYRVHNSHLINLAHIKEYNKGKGGYVSMVDGSEVEVSSRRKADFLKQLSTS